jgi:hypothetical protein
VRWGPFRLGLDGLLSWAPGLGEAYSTLAAVFLIVQGLRARVPAPVLALCAILMTSRTAIGAVPLVGPAAADLFLAHRWSARLILRAIDAELAREARAADVGAFAAGLAA